MIWQIFTIRTGQERIAYHGGVGESDDETVFGGCIAVLSLCDESLSCVVIGFAFPTLHTQISACSVDACLSPAIMERQ